MAVAVVLPILKSPSMFYVSCAVLLCYPLLPWGPLWLETAQLLWAFCFTLSPCLCALIGRHFFLASRLNSLFQHCLTSSHSAPQSTAWLCCCDGLLLDTSRTYPPKAKNPLLLLPGWAWLLQPLLTGQLLHSLWPHSYCKIFFQLSIGVEDI